MKLYLKYDEVNFPPIPTTKTYTFDKWGKFGSWADERCLKATQIISVRSKAGTRVFWLLYLNALNGISKPGVIEEERNEEGEREGETKRERAES